MNDNERVVSLLEQIQQNQRVQLERQHEALMLQREQLALVQKQFDRAEALQTRAEELQNKGAQMVGAARKAAAILVPIVLLLIAYVSWLLFRY